MNNNTYLLPLLIVMAHGSTKYYILHYIFYIPIPTLVSNSHKIFETHVG